MYLHWGRLPAEGSSALALVHFNSLHECACMDRHARTTFSPHHHHHQAFHSRLHLHSCFAVIFLSGTQTGDTMMGVAHDGGGGTSCARRRRERRLRSFLRHERMAVTLHLAEALHHSSGASLEPVAERREEEVEAEVVYDAHGDRSSLHRGCGREVFPTSGRRSRWQPRSVTWLLGPRLTPVVLVQDAVHDDKTLAWLLERALDERQREKEEAEGAEVVKQLEVVHAEAEDKLFVAMEEFRVCPSRPSGNSLSPALKAAVHWHVAVDRVRKRKRKGRRRKRRRRTTAWRAVPVRCLGAT